MSGVFVLFVLLVFLFNFVGTLYPCLVLSVNHGSEESKPVLGTGKLLGVGHEI